MSRLIRAQERGGGVSPITPISETAEPIFTIQTEFDSPGGELSCGPIQLSSVQPMTSQVRSKITIFTVFKPSGKCAILGDELPKTSIKNSSSES